jgi:hypothetical protein
MESSMAGIEPEGIENRFSRLVTRADSVGESIIGKLKTLAHDINQTVGADTPAFRSIIQRLEQAAHVASTAPAMQEAADPTLAAPETDAATEEATTSTEPNSTPNSNASASTSSTDSKE